MKAAALGRGGQAPSLTFIEEYEEFQQEIGSIIPAVQKEQDLQGGGGQPFTWKRRAQRSGLGGRAAKLC